jgi:hypothetical protein
MGARYYDPQLGRFTQPDPSGQEKNPYLYAGGNFINNSDPTGLITWATYGKACLQGGAQSVVVGLFTGASETGVGAIGAFAGGCATDVGLEVQGRRRHRQGCALKCIRREARGLPSSPPAKEDQVNGFGLVVLIVIVAAVAALGMWLQGTGFRDYLRRRRGER